MSGNKETQIRQRSMSAKSHATRSRPLSGMPSTTIRLSTGNLKTQLISSIYYNRQKSPAKKNSNKNFIYPGISTQQLAKFKKSANLGTAKSKQDLYQQNIQLKKQINKINEQFAILKSKTQTKSKKVIQKNKKLDMEFQKQIFWTGNKTHMIQGVKFQYQKLKKQHMEQTKKYKQLKTVLLDSKIPEYKIYAQAVQNENKRLVQKLNKIYENQQLMLQAPQGQQKQVSKILIAEAEQSNRNLQKKLIEFDTQLRNANQNIKDKEKKMQFLQKLIIQKDNRQHHIGRKLKKTQKQKNQCQLQVQQLHIKIKQMEKQKQKEIKQLQQKQKQQKNKLQQKFNIQLHERDKIIQNLEQQNRLLQNTVNKLRMSASVVNTNNNSHVNLTHQNMSNGVKQTHNQNKKNKGSQVQRQKQQKSRQQIDKYDSVLSKDMNENHPKQKDSRFRVVQRANKKHSQNSKKTRKVQFHEIQGIGQILRYRLINQNIDSNKMKDYFSYNKQKFDQNHKTQTQQQWSTQYINMGQTQKTLSSYPFMLDNQSSFLLSRYIIEDCHQQFVYTDAGNQNTREVVKSIIKAIVGSYELTKQETKARAAQFMEKYETNLESALRTYNPNGKVTKKKFIDTINGLGVEVGQDVAQYLLGKAFKNSKNLQQIQYNYLFVKQAQKK